MKKVFFIIIAALPVLSGYAQDTSESAPATDGVLKSKRGFPILPQSSEWALGVSATSIVTYFGNLLNGNTNNVGANFNYAAKPLNLPVNNLALFGKKVLDENTAIRARFGFGKDVTIIKAVAQQNVLAPDPTSPAYTEDWRKISSTGVIIAGGLEKRRGQTRLQGIYGGELLIGFASQKTEYQYGNPMSLDFNAPITTNFGGNIIAGSTAAATTRTVEDKFGNYLFVGARGFVGVEYFFAPKMSVSGEFGYTLGTQMQSKGLRTDETWDPTQNQARQVKTDTFNNNGITYVGVGLDNLNGAISLLFYF